jgi:hypothetical protein
VTEHPPLPVVPRPEQAGAAVRGGGAPARGRQRYGRRDAEAVEDTQWINEATADGRILLGADRRILRNRLERQAICRARARYVVFGTNNLRVTHMVELFAAHLPRLAELAGEPGPWVFRIAQHGLHRLALDCSDT